MFQRKDQFSGSLDDEQYSVLPPSLVAMVQLTLGSTNFENQHDVNINGAVSSIAQLLIFN